MQTTQRPQLSLDEFLARLDNVRSSSSGYSARCPAHDDRKNSLGVTSTETGGVLFNCLAGCSFSEVMTAIEGRQPKPSITVRHSTTKPIDEKSSTWWENYTGVPILQWQEWGCVFSSKTIEFTWTSSSVRKGRKAGSKEIFWEGNPSPPLWPDVPDVLPPRIYITEGESDFGVLRYLGYPAWAITKGADSGLGGAWDQLKIRGVREVIIAFDDDKAGRTGAQRLSGEVFAAGIEAHVLEIGSEVNSIMGEKDIRDIWRRVFDEEKMRDILDHLTDRALARRPIALKVSVNELLSMPIPAENWLIDKVWLRSNVGMIVGAPKMGKSYLTLDMGISIATGTPFLGTFDVPRAGPVIILGKEDTNAALQARVSSILISKGFGGQIALPSIHFPQKTDTIPLFFDLARDYIFDPSHTEELIQWLYRIEDKWGEIAMVVVDPVLKSLPVGIDEYRASEIGASVFSSAMRIQQATNAGVCLVHHRPKGTSTGKNSLGSVMFFAASETSLFLQGDEPDEGGYVGVQGVYKSAADQFWKYKFDLTDDSYGVTVDRTASPMKITTTKHLEEEIYGLMMADNTGFSIPQLSEELGTKDQPIRRVLKLLEASGKVRHDDPKGKFQQYLWYAVPEPVKV